MQNRTAGGEKVIKIGLVPKKNRAYKALMQGDRKRLLEAQPLELIFKVSNGFSKVLRVELDPTKRTCKLV